jgi:hypothetical protein
MPVKLQEYPTLDLTIFDASGFLTFTDIMKVLKVFYEYPVATPTKNALWDLRRAIVKDLSVSEIEQIVEYSRIYSTARSGGKTAIIAPGALENSIALALGSQCRGLPIHVRVFDKREQAVRWFDERQNRYYN